MRILLQNLLPSSRHLFLPRMLTQIQGQMEPTFLHLISHFQASVAHDLQNRKIFYSNVPPKVTFLVSCIAVVWVQYSSTLLDTNYFCNRDFESNCIPALFKTAQTLKFKT